MLQIDKSSKGPWKVLDLYLNVQLNATECIRMCVYSRGIKNVPDFILNPS